MIIHFKHYYTTIHCTFSTYIQDTGVIFIFFKSFGLLTILLRKVSTCVFLRLSLGLFTVDSLACFDWLITIFWTMLFFVTFNLNFSTNSFRSSVRSVWRWRSSLLFFKQYLCECSSCRLYFLLQLLQCHSVILNSTCARIRARAHHVPLRAPKMMGGLIRGPQILFENVCRVKRKTLIFVLPFYLLIHKLDFDNSFLSAMFRCLEPLH